MPATRPTKFTKLSPLAGSLGRTLPTEMEVYALGILSFYVYVSDQPSGRQLVYHAGIKDYISNS